MDSSLTDTITATARDAVHNFAHFASLAESGKEVIITRRGKPSLKLVRAEPVTAMALEEREALIRKVLSFRFSKPYPGKFNRSDAYDE